MKKQRQWLAENKWTLDTETASLMKDIMFEYFKHKDTDELGHSWDLELDNVLVQ